MSDTTPQEASSGQSADQTPNTGPLASAAPQRQRGLRAAEPPMRCADARPYLSAYADGELAESLRPLVAAHIAGCAECRALVQRAQSVDRLLASLPRTTPSPQVYERVQAAVARRGLDPVVREPLRSARWAQEIGGVSARAVKRLLTPRVVYPQEPDLADDEPRPAGAPIPFRRRAPWAVAALPGIAALLLISLSLAIFNGLALGHPTEVVAVTSTPSPQVGAGLRQAEIALQREESNVSFRPVMPTYLPSGAHLSKLTADKSADTLVILWDFASASGVQQVSLREAPTGQGFGFVGCQGANAAFGSEWLQWGLPNLPGWTPLTCDGRTNSPAVGQQRTTLDIALTATPRSPAAADAAVATLRITSLSMDTDYQAQASLESKLGLNPQPNANVYLHFAATANDPSGQQYTVTGETNTPFIQANGHRLERITIVGGGANVTDIVNGAGSFRYDNTASTLQGLPYPTQSPLYVGRDGEPGAGATYYFSHLASSMESGEVWVVKTNASLNNRQMIELVVVDAPVVTIIYVDAQSYVVTQVSMAATAGSGSGAVGAPNRLATGNVVCPGTGSSVPDCSIRYSVLWITTKPTSANDFSLTPPVPNGRALAFHLKQSDTECQTL
ncbi:MAG TPA: zf-HC2 domain-containing protein [Ktedonobacterales bacterium]|nr:zf-HC2 domain-containing protein [Ktedonobacterales bacterium]